MPEGRDCGHAGRVCWADLAVRPDPVPGRQFFTREPGQHGQRDRNQIRHVMRMDQPRDRLISGQRRGGSTRFPWGFNSVP